MEDEAKRRQARPSLGMRLFVALFSSGCAVSTISEHDEQSNGVSASSDAGDPQPTAPVEFEVLDAAIGPTFAPAQPRTDAPQAAGDGGAMAALRDASVAVVRDAEMPSARVGDAAAPSGSERGADMMPRDAATPRAPEPARDASAPEPRDAAAGRDAAPADGAAATPFTLTSSALRSGAALPERYRCDGSSPPLAWSPGPRGTLSYALVFRDLSDARDLWVLYDIPSSVRELAEGVPRGRSPARPAGAHQAENYQGEPSYVGPCDLLGRNNLELTLHAVDVAELPLLLGENASTASVLDRLVSHDLARSKLTLTSRN